MLRLETPTASLPILEATLRLPAYGLWQASLVVDTEDPADLVGAATLVVTEDEQERSFSGFIFQAGVHGSRGYVRLLAGKGGLILPIPPKGYRNAPARLPASDICTEVGETLDPSSQGLDTLLQHWGRRAGVASQLITDLANALSLPWRVTESGSLFIGERAEEEFTEDYQVLKRVFRSQIVDLELSGAASLMPGQRLQEGLVDFVQYQWSGDSRTTKVRVSA